MLYATKGLRQCLGYVDGGFLLAWLILVVVMWLAETWRVGEVAALLGLAVPLTFVTPLVWPLVWLAHARASWAAARESTRRELAHAAALGVFPACCVVIGLLAAEPNLARHLERSPWFPRAGWLGAGGSLWLFLTGACFYLRTRTPGWRLPGHLAEPPSRDLA